MHRTFIEKWQDSPKLRRTDDTNSFAFLGILLATLLLTASPALGQAALDCNEENSHRYLDLGATVPLDNTGVGSWNFLNPRRPFVLVRPKRFPKGDPRVDTASTLQENCFATLLAGGEDLPPVVLSFVNQTVDRSFDVTIPFEIRLPKASALQEARTDLILMALAPKLDRFEDISPEIPAEADRRSVPTGVTENLKIPQDPTVTEVQQFVTDLEPLRDYLESSEGEAKGGELNRLRQAVEDVDKLNLEIKALVDIGNPVTASVPRSPEDGIAKAIQAFTEACRNAVKTASAQLGNGKAANDPSRSKGALELCKRSVDNLKNNGIDTADLEKSEFMTDVRRMDDFFALFLPSDDSEEDNGQDLSLKLSELCQGKDGLLSCSYRLSVEASGKPEPVPQRLLPTLPKGVVEFKVSFRNEGITPTNNTGYLATVPKPGETTKPLTWALTGSIGYGESPDTDAVKNALPPPDTPVEEGYSILNPYEGRRLSQFNGSGTLDLETFLGNRAKSQVAVTFKRGSLGGISKDPDTTQTEVRKYTLDVYADTGLGLRLGNYEMAAPASKISINEAGEGFEIFWRWLSLGYIVKRESLLFKADGRNLDSDVAIAQIRNFSTTRMGPVRSFSLTLSRGEDENPDKAGEFWSAGAEIYFSEPTSTIAGSLAYFMAETEPEGQYPANKRRKGAGDVGLLTVGKSWLDENGKQQRVLSLQVGYGTGDDPSSSNKNEGYLGESAAFTGGSFFLSTVNNRIDLDGSTADVDPIGSGLSNKRYVGVSYTDKVVFSPLQAIARHLLRIEESIIAEKAMVLRLHHFQFDEEILGSQKAGTEVGIEFQIQVPKGVTTSLGYSRFFSGKALEDIFEKEPWALTSTITVKI